jgi:integrase
MAESSFRFTQTSVGRCVCPTGKPEILFWDSTLPGFGLRLYASGRRVWLAQYRDAAGRTRRLTLGDARTVKLDEAREAARQNLARAELGDDPQAERRAARKAIRVGALVDAYLEHQQGRMRPRSLIEATRHLRKHAAPLHQEAAEQAGRAEVVRLLASIAKASGAVTANRVRATLSAMWTWALRSGLLDGDNPVARTPKPGEEAPRQRVLADAELALIWNACASGQDHDRIVRLLLLTGARREEVAAMQWNELVFAPDGSALWTLPAARSKNGLAHEVPLPALAVAQLPPRGPREFVFGQGVGGFSGWSRCKARLDSRMGALIAREVANAPEAGSAPSPWVLHDLRRTFSTWANENGLEPHIVEACLNHASGAAKRGVAGIYNKALYREPKRIALLRWSDHVGGLVGEREPRDASVVIRLHGAA